MEQTPILEALNWRYATSIFDEDQIIPESILQDILEAGNLTATAFGIQGFNMVLLEGKVWRERLESATFNQKNIQTCSHLLVLAHRTDVDEAYVEDYTRLMEEVRSLEKGSLEGFTRSCVNFLGSFEQEHKDHWLAKQVYIVMGNLLATCAMYRVDSCPMEGFNGKLVDEVLGLDQKNLKSVLLLPIGYRSEEDKYAKIDKIRKPLDEMVIRM